MSTGDLHVTRDFDKGEISVSEEIATVVVPLADGSPCFSVVITDGPVTAKMPPENPPPRR